MEKKLIQNILSISGGKDSTAMALLAFEREVENVRMVFADTGHEHPVTYGYVEYLDGWFRREWGRGIEVVKADFTRKLEVRRRNLQKTWEGDVPQERIDKALKNLHPTGNPFLDLCKLHGRFPSTRARFCTKELKHQPIEREVIEPAVAESQAVISWQGVRAEESASRAELLQKDVEFGEWEPEPKGLLLYRPILDWKVDQVFDQHRKHGVDWNPLYNQGMTRVGCMPCIMAKKSELRQIGRRFPDQVDRLVGWEEEIQKTAKTGWSSFFSADKTPLGRDAMEESGDRRQFVSVREVFDWARTGRGGRQLDLVNLIEEQEDYPSCSSVYGLCE